MRSLEHALVILFLAIAFGVNLQRVPFHPDESSWIGSSAVFEELLRGNFASEVWDPGNWQQGTVGMEPYVPITTNSTITRDLIGIGRRLGGYTEADLNKIWDFGKTDQQNALEGRRPSPGLLSWSRLPMAVLAVASIYLLFVLVRNSFGRVSAYLLVLCFALGTFFLQSLGRAMDEAPLLAGITLTILAAKKYLEAGGSPRRQLLWLALLSGAIGFSCGAKLTGFSTALVGAAVVVLHAARRSVAWRQRLGLAAAHLAMLTGGAYLTFLLPNLFLLTHPVRGPLAMLEYRNWLVAVQYEWVAPEMRIATFQVRMHLFLQHVFSDYAVVSSVPYLLFILTLLGLAVCSWLALKWFRGKATDAGPTVMLIMAVCTFMPNLLIRIDLERYYLLPVGFSTIFAAVSLGGKGILGFASARRLA